MPKTKVMKKNYLSLILLLISTFCFSQMAERETTYRRSSLYTVMIESPGLPYAEEIKAYFTKSPIPDKFNDHNLGKRIYTSEELASGENAVLGNNDPLRIIARDLVAKWFNRDAKGAFNMDLVAQRGNYDASAIDIATARASKRGVDLLADAGEELIGKTFVLVNEFKYVNKEEVAAAVNTGLSILKFVADQAGAGTLSNIASGAQVASTVAGKGYVVKTTASLYQLVWDEETAAMFYSMYWADAKTITPDKKRAFEEAIIFKLKLIGSDTSWADVQSTIFTNKTEVELVERATMKAMDAVIVKLQKSHDVFKTKTPIFTGTPLTAKIGLKEGLTTKSQFEVIEQRIDENGRTKYARVGTVKVDPSYPLWDNRFGADEENPDSKIDRTYFRRVSGGPFYEGMLLVQKGGKGFATSREPVARRTSEKTEGVQQKQDEMQDQSIERRTFLYLRAGIGLTHFVIDEQSSPESKTDFFFEVGFEHKGGIAGLEMGFSLTNEGEPESNLMYLNLSFVPKVYLAKFLSLDVGADFGYLAFADDEILEEYMYAIDIKAQGGIGIHLGDHFAITAKARIGVLTNYIESGWGWDWNLRNSGYQFGLTYKFL